MFLILCTLSFLLAILYLVISVKNKHRVWAKKGINFVEPKFLIGNVQLIRTKHVSILSKELYEKFPEERYHGVYQFSQPALIIKDPNLIKQITIKDFDHFVDHKNFIEGVKDPLWTKNLFVSEGEKWRDMRATLSPVFTGSKLRIMFHLMEECAQQFVDYFLKESTSDRDVLELDIKDAFSRFANDVIATTAFGLKCDSLRNRKSEFFLMGKEATNIDVWKIIMVSLYNISPPLARFLNFKMIPTKVANYFYRVIKDTLKVREEQNIVRPDMIHLLMEARKNKSEITIEDITAQSFLFFFAGFDTVSSALSFIFYELALNPEIQDRLRKELLQVQEPITYESLLSLEYLDMVLSESLRKWPPVAITNRKVTKAYTIQPAAPNEKPLYLEKNLIVWLPVYALHRDPKYFPDPERFDPERFSEKNKSKINHSVYIPFGSGPRNCIGSRFALMEIKIIVYYILKGFEIVPVARTNVPMEIDPKQISLTSKNGMWLGLRKRQ